MKNQALSRSLHSCLIVFFSFITLTLASTPLTTPAYSADVTLAWNSVTEADSYKVYYGLESGNYEVTTNTIYQTSHTISDLDPGTYYFAVTASNEYGESDYSTELPCTIEDPVPATYSITASAGAHGNISP